MTSILSRLFLLYSLTLLTSCQISELNNPYPAIESGQSDAILYSSFSERPKHLDPAVAYSANEYSFIGQIYEPPLQYHYLKRPYQLEPLTAVKMPTVHFLDDRGEPLKGHFSADQVAISEYIIDIKPGINYQPHPAFVTKNRHLQASQIDQLTHLSDLPTSTRELTSDDYIYQIKRLADPKIQSPIAEIMKHYIVGFNDFAQQVAKLDKLAIQTIPMSGVERLSQYQYKIKIKGKYPQFRFWLAMPFFAPMPWEADAFYQQPGLNEKNITLDWFPVGTGAYYLIENNPNRRMTLIKNPNFHPQFYPQVGEAEDQKTGLLADAGKRLPFIDRAIFTLEKETIPYWNKFLQGYYDASGISSDSFDQAVQFTGTGHAQLTEQMKNQGIQLQSIVTNSIFYMGFNMLDPVVGGRSERARKLRLAISIALDYESYIAIFMNGRAIPAQGILPPGIFGYQSGQSGINPYVYDFIDHQYRRKSIEEARQLMNEAGYQQGIDPKTGESLVLYFDTTAVSADDRPRMNWYRQQFSKLGIKLIIRPTDYNRFQEKMRQGRGQLFIWGWNADYPDPENFFFLLYSANGKTHYGGENAVNYHNQEFDRLFEQMRNMDNTPERYAIIQKMQEIIRQDAPWVFAFHPQNFSLFHRWYKNLKPHLMANNRLKYARIDSQLRQQKRQQWNRAVVWPLGLIFFILILSIMPALYWYRQRNRATLQN